MDNELKLTLTLTQTLTQSSNLQIFKSELRNKKQEVS